MRALPDLRLLDLSRGAQLDVGRLVVAELCQVILDALTDCLYGR